MERGVHIRDLCISSCLLLWWNEKLQEPEANRKYCAFSRTLFTPNYCFCFDYTIMNSPGHVLVTILVLLKVSGTSKLKVKAADPKQVFLFSCFAHLNFISCLYLSHLLYFNKTIIGAPSLCVWQKNAVSCFPEESLLFMIFSVHSSCKVVRNRSWIFSKHVNTYFPQLVSVHLSMLPFWVTGL